MLQNAIGVADFKVIPYARMDASSKRENKNKYGPNGARLNDNSGEGWCAQSSGGNQDWLRIDLGKTFEICGVATQGSVKNQNGYTRDFKLSFSPDGSGWTPYSDTDGTQTVIRDSFLYRVAVTRYLGRGTNSVKSF